jgi:hypothetical protein
VVVKRRGLKVAKSKLAVGEGGTSYYLDGACILELTREGTCSLDFQPLQVSEFYYEYSPSLVNIPVVLTRGQGVALRKR